MNSQTQFAQAKSGSWPALPEESFAGISAWLLHGVDAGLLGVILVAPYFFGGRHDLGRFVFVTLMAVTATAWFVRQALRPTSPWKDTAAFGLLLLAVGLLVLQIVPLPTAWLHGLAPRTAELLPLWQPSGDGAGMLGSWNTISMVPHETTKALAMLLAYGLLFVVVVQRLENLDDVRRMLRWVAASAVAMAVFGLLQYFTSNGKFFWFYEYPFRSTDSYVCGSFINRNHFANFLVLGVGPLVAWLLESLRQQSPVDHHRRHTSPQLMPTIPVLLGIALAVVLFAVVLTTSRGGTLALMISVVVMGLIYSHARLIDTKHLWLYAGMAVVVLGLLSLYGYDQITSRLSTLTQGSMEAVDRAASRQKIWTANIAAFRHGGLAGAGAGSHALIYPVYYPEAETAVSTHAESGYLQIASETGFVGVTLLATAIGLCGVWCLTCLRRQSSDLERLCFGATCSGLVASVAHSIADFVWYIPACMSVTLILAACTLRLAQLSAGDQSAAQRETRLVSRRLAYAYGLASPLVVGVGIWMAWTYFGPAIASVHWDHYLHVSIANRDLSQQALSNLVSNRGDAPTTEEDRAAILQAMIRHLGHVLAWDPAFAPARFRLAGRQVSEFERRQRAAANAMDATQIRDAALASQFASPRELRNWVHQAFGQDSELLIQALENTHAGLALSPLAGEGYLMLADLCFLDCAEPTQVAAYIDQGLRVRPHDGDLLFEVGKQAMAAGDVETAMQQWTKCFRDAGPHQLKIVYLLAGRIPAALFIEGFRPDWHTLPQIWARYRELGQSQDLSDLAAYSAGVAERQVREIAGIRPDNIWLWQASMHRDLKQSELELACLEKAYRLNPHSFDVRSELGRALMDAGRFSEAEPHYRWCLARRPEYRNLRVALAQIRDQRRAQQNLGDVAESGVARAWER